MRGVRVCNEKEAPRGRASQHRRPRMEVAACGGGRAAAMTRGWLEAASKKFSMLDRARTFQPRRCLLALHGRSDAFARANVPVVRLVCSSARSSKRVCFFCRRVSPTQGCPETQRCPETRPPRAPVGVLYIVLYPTSTRVRSTRYMDKHKIQKRVSF